MIQLLHCLELAILASTIGFQAAPPTSRTPTCASEDCHVEQISYTFLHGPTAADFCRGCHAYADESKHTFELKRSGAEQCNFCHMGKTDLGGLVVHEPTEKEECLGCHNPHGSNRRNMLSKFNNREMCLSCHDDLLEDRSKLHTPITRGDCLDCHRAHASMHESLLINDWGQMCRTCHQPEFESASHVTTIPSDPTDAPQFQEPGVDDCGICHDPHGSNHDFLLTDSPFSLCGKCHEEVSKTAVNSIMSHSFIAKERACLTCHTTHIDKGGSLLSDHPIIICLECHANDIAINDETILSPPPDLVHPDPETLFHGPLSEGECKGCHLPHGASQRGFLAGAFTENFHEVFSENAYELCFSCHDSNLVTLAQTTDATQFRNGSSNLHFIHVQSGEKPGRSCRVCHTIHSSTLPRQMRDSVRFGEWNLPIKFQLTANGGSCAAGCHRAFRYDRISPVTNRVED